MATDAVNCNACGAALLVGPATNFVTCNRCGAQLAVRRTADSTFTEPVADQARHHLTDEPVSLGRPGERLPERPRELRALEEPLDGLALDNELARLDRGWQSDRETSI